MKELRCVKCKRLLFFYGGEEPEIIIEIKCTKCGFVQIWQPSKTKLGDFHSILGKTWDQANRVKRLAYEEIKRQDHEKLKTSNIA